MWPELPFFFASYLQGFGWHVPKSSYSHYDRYESMASRPGVYGLGCSVSKVLASLKKG